MSRYEIQKSRLADLRMSDAAVAHWFTMYEQAHVGYLEMLEALVITQTEKLAVATTRLIDAQQNASDPILTQNGKPRVNGQRHKTRSGKPLRP